MYKVPREHPASIHTVWRIACVHWFLPQDCPRFALRTQSLLMPVPDFGTFPGCVLSKCCGDPFIQTNSRLLRATKNPRRVNDEGLRIAFVFAAVFED